MGRWSGTQGLGLGRGSVPVNTRHQKEAGSAAGSPGSQGCGSPGRAHTDNRSF